MKFPTRRANNAETVEEGRRRKEKAGRRHTGRPGAADGRRERDKPGRDGEQDHADGDEDLARVALREVREETGVRSARLVSDEIYSLEVLTVDGHEKRGVYVPSHLHLNVTYLIEADEHDALTVCEAENSGVRWFTLEGALNASTEPWFVQRIYTKLNEKLKRA